MKHRTGREASAEFYQGSERHVPLLMRVPNRGLTPWIYFNYSGDLGGSAVMGYQGG